MIYLDNAATSYPKPRCVINEFERALKIGGGNPGRSSHRLSVAASEIIFDSREAVAKLFSLPNAENVVFCYNATHALNLAIKSYVKDGAHVIISDIEHNSVLRPIHAMSQRNGVSYSCFDSKGDIDKEISRLITPRTTCIVSSLMSNVTGESIDLDTLSKAARKRGLFLIVDASQIAGHRKIEMRSDTCDVLCAPAHKGLFGISGCGFALFRECERMQSFIEGGSGSESMNPEMPITLPDAYEAGTPATAAIASLRSGIDLVNKIGLEHIESRLNSLCAILGTELSERKAIRLYSSQNGITLFNLNGYDSSTVARLLDKRNICVRDGLHCAPLAHKKIGTIGEGAIRVSFSCFNTQDEIKELLSALDEIASGKMF